MRIEKNYEDSALLSLLAQNSEYAFQLIFDRYRNTIYKVAMMYVKSPAVAEEILQDVFLKLWFQRAHLTGILSLQSWLFILTKNLTLNCVKKIAHESTARARWTQQNAISENTADHKILSLQYQQLFREAVSHLPAQQQQVFLLAKDEGLSYDAISRQLSISPLTVKTHMARALASIRTFLKKHGDLSVLLILTGLRYFS